MPGPDHTASEQVILHGSCVCWGEVAVLIIGASGRGKSSLALRLMSLGCTLVADDRTIVRLKEGTLEVSCPAAIAGKIESRGVGILQAPYRDTAPLACVVDLDRTETERLPPDREILLLKRPVKLFHKVETVAFPDAILHYLKQIN